MPGSKSQISKSSTMRQHEDVCVVQQASLHSSSFASLLPTSWVHKNRWAMQAHLCTSRQTSDFYIPQLCCCLSQPFLLHSDVFPNTFVQIRQQLTTGYKTRTCLLCQVQLVKIRKLKSGRSFIPMLPLESVHGLSRRQDAAASCTDKTVWRCC